MCCIVRNRRYVECYEVCEKFAKAVAALRIECESGGGFQSPCHNEKLTPAGFLIACEYHIAGMLG